MKISELPKLNDLKLVTAACDSPVMAVARRMAKFNIGIVVVVDGQMDIVGVLSERDILWCLGTGDIPIEEAIVGDLMTKSVVTISPEESLVEAVLTMNAHGTRHLIMAENNKPVGVLSIRDLLQAFAQQQLEGDAEIDDQNSRQFVVALAAS